jgi:predicted nuclease of predicted toxin-antitoxin system
VTLFFDENLSPTLATWLATVYPGSRHVRDAGLRGATDAEIWEHARLHGLTIVSKDTDFRERSFVEGFPPKVVWLDVGNAGTQAIAQLLERERNRVERFASANDVSLLILSLDSRAI